MVTISADDPGWEVARVVRVFLLSGRELALDAARVGATVQKLKEYLRDVYGFPVCKNF